jgi:hypothetical protein
MERCPPKAEVVSSNLAGSARNRNKRAISIDYYRVIAF